MPDKDPNILAKLAEWGWLSLVALGGYIFRSLAGQVKDNQDALADHVIGDIKTHEDFVQKDDLTEMKANMFARFDKLDIKQDRLLDKVVLGVSREEVKGELASLYNKIDSLEQRKSDK